MRDDGSEYYISSEPKSQGERVFYWVLDWQGEYIQKRNSWGAFEDNPLRKTNSIRLCLSERDIDILYSHEAWITGNKSKRKCNPIQVLQYDGSYLQIAVTESPIFGFDFTIQLESSYSMLPSNLEHFEVNLSANQLSFSYLKK